MSHVRDAFVFFFFSSRRRHTRFKCDWSSDVCSSDLAMVETIKVPDQDRFHLKPVLIGDLDGLHHRAVDGVADGAAELGLRALAQGDSDQWHAVAMPHPPRGCVRARCAGGTTSGASAAKSPTWKATPPSRGA